MLFNKQYMEIINLATNKDPEFEQSLKHMLAELTDEEKTKIQNCEEVSSLGYGKGGDVLVVSSLGYGKDVDVLVSVDFVTNSYKSTSSLIVEIMDKITSESIEYELNLYGFSKKNIDRMLNLPAIDSIRKNHHALPLLQFFVRGYNSKKEVTLGKGYLLELIKVNDEYYLNYNRTNSDFENKEENGTVMGAESITIIEKEELDRMLGLDSNLSL